MGRNVPEARILNRMPKPTTKVTIFPTESKDEPAKDAELPSRRHPPVAGWSDLTGWMRASIDAIVRGEKVPLIKIATAEESGGRVTEQLREGIASYLQEFRSDLRNMLKYADPEKHQAAKRAFFADRLYLLTQDLQHLDEAARLGYRPIRVTGTELDLSAITRADLVTPDNRPGPRFLEVRQAIADCVEQHLARSSHFTITANPEVRELLRTYIVPDLKRDERHGSAFQWAMINYREEPRASRGERLPFEDLGITRPPHFIYK